MEKKSKLEHLDSLFQYTALSTIHSLTNYTHIQERAVFKFHCHTARESYYVQQHFKNLMKDQGFDTKLVKTKHEYGLHENQLNKIV